MSHCAQLHFLCQARTKSFLEQRFQSFFRFDSCSPRRYGYGDRNAFICRRFSRPERKTGVTRPQMSGAWTGTGGRYNTSGRASRGHAVCVQILFFANMINFTDRRRQAISMPTRECVCPAVLWQARRKPFHEKSSQNSFGSTPAVFGGIVGVAKMQSLRRFLTTRTKKRCDALAGVGVDRQGSKYPLSVLF